jgi:hypothetical protein
MKVSNTKKSGNGDSSTFTSQFSVEMLVDLAAISTGIIITTAFFAIFGGES